MPPLRFRLNNHLIVPFACPKWEIDSIRITGVSTDATFFESETPCVYIARKSKEPLRLQSFPDVWPFSFTAAQTSDWRAALDVMENHIHEFGSIGTREEHQFLTAYFHYLRDVTNGVVDRLQYAVVRDRFPRQDPDWVFDALLPLPQAHLYVVDPLEEVEYERYAASPKNMFKVDFVFWTGEKLVAIEIDGGSHIGSEKHIRKDRMLQRAGVQVIHILNSEIQENPRTVMERLMPKSIVEFWKSLSDLPYNPLAFVPF